MTHTISFENTTDVEIDDEGRFKYILIQISKSKNSTESKQIVRGFKWADFHADIYDDFTSRSDFPSKCVGGGRIYHESVFKRLTVYGYSQGYGIADHEATSSILKNTYPGYEITWNNDGY